MEDLKRQGQIDLSVLLSATGHKLLLPITSGYRLSGRGPDIWLVSSGIGRKDAISLRGRK